MAELTGVAAALPGSPGVTPGDAVSGGGEVGPPQLAAEHQLRERACRAKSSTGRRLPTLSGSPRPATLLLPGSAEARPLS
jgi:hypothetical protein